MDPRPLPASPLLEANPPPTDLRGLDPPEPLVRILDGIDAGGDGPLVFLLEREPFPLYAMLAAAGWRHCVRRLPDAVQLTVFREPPAG